MYEPRRRRQRADSTFTSEQTLSYSKYQTHGGARTRQTLEPHDVSRILASMSLAPAIRHVTFRHRESLNVAASMHLSWTTEV